MKKDSIKLGNLNLEFETGDLAKQADGSVILRYGESVLLATAQSGRIRTDIDYFPLSVDFREKAYAFGRIPGGFLKREGAPTTKQTLISRLIDRPIRPLFPKGYSNEVQILITCFSADKEYDHDVGSINGASMALLLSSIPFTIPVGAVRIGKIGECFIVNPSFKEIEQSELDLIIAGTQDGIMMVESGANEVNENVMIQALDVGHQEIIKICKFQKNFAEGTAKTKTEFKSKTIPEEYETAIMKLIKDKLKKCFPIDKKPEYDKKSNIIKNEILEIYKDNLKEELNSKNIESELAELIMEKEVKSIKKYINLIFETVERNIVRKYCLENNRIDNRNSEQIRPLKIQTGILPQSDGSGIFTRGETQSMGICILGGEKDKLCFNETFEFEKKSFFLHYNFPPYSTGEVKRVGCPKRREIGHGALAERAIKPIIPEQEKFDKTIRIVSEILESNGSSSMATVCAATLALLDANVPIKNPVAGIAMGLVKETDKTVILTDIHYLEDHHGDMDFKVCGTREGITSLQMDIKIKGITKEIMAKALEQAKKARFEILDKIEQEQN